MLGRPVMQSTPLLNQVISRDGIMKDYPKPKIEALFTPKLDEDVKKQIEREGKGPHYGVEKHLYNLKSGTLTCLWADHLNRNARVNLKDVILLLQNTLTLLGSAFYTITQERRRVALSKVNPRIGLYQRTQRRVRIRWRSWPCLVAGTRNGPPTMDLPPSQEWTSSSVPSVEQPGNSALAVVSGKEFVHHSRASPWGRQLCGRRGIQGDLSNGLYTN